MPDGFCHAHINWLGTAKAGGYVQWQALYDSCICETNLQRLEKLVFETEDAIFLRLRELATKPHLSDESQALKQAAQKLLKLKTEKLGWPNPTTVSSFPVPTEPRQ